MSLSFILISIFAAVGCIYSLIRHVEQYVARRKVIRSAGCKPPVALPQKDPILGVDVVMQNLQAAKDYKFLELLRNRHAAMGMTFTTSTFTRITINTCDPKVIQAVLASQFDDFGMGPLRRNSAAPLLGKGIFTSDGQTWAHQRALIRPSFVRAQVTDFDIFERHVDQLFSLMKQRNYIMDLQALFFRMVLDSNSEYLFGESVGLLTEDASHTATHFHESLDYAQQATILRLRLGKAMWIHRDKKHRDACKAVHSYADNFVTQAIEFRKSKQFMSPGLAEKSASGKTKYVFLNELAKDTNDPIMLRDQIVNMLLAARDTTAGLLSFTCYLLARHPRVWQKLREDVAEHYTNPLTYEAVMKMTYLRFVLQETLRLFPPISTNSRMANKDTVIPCGGGPEGRDPLYVKKNNVVTYSTFVMHRRPEHFGPDADEFLPERWKKMLPGWEYLPFNGGPRICPGQKFAMTESSYTIARFAHEFADLQALDLGEEWREQLTLSLTLNNGVHVRAVPDAAAA